MVLVALFTAYADTYSFCLLLKLGAKEPCYPQYGGYRGRCINCIGKLVGVSIYVASATSI